MHKPVSEHSRPSNFTVPLRDAKTEKFAVASLVILIAYAVLRDLVGAATRPFWYDEVCTVIVTRQRSLSGIWKALAHAADAQAPGFYLIERISAAFIRNQEVAFRLPSILGFCCITICLFVFTRRRVGGAYALVCAAIPFTTSLFNWYATEARPYSLLVACIAIALVAYQSAPTAAWMLVMCLALAASIALNYYAVFAMVPFGLAELDVLVVRRRIRWRVWIALACGVVPLAVFWPLLAKLKQYYGEHFWSGASLSGLIHIYGAFFMSSPPFGAAIAAAALLGTIGLIVLLALNPESTAAQTTTPAHEYVLVLALVGLPAIGFLVAKLTHSGMTERYVLAAVLGISLAAGCILPLLDRKSVILAVGFLVALLAVQEAAFWVAHKHQLTHFDSPADSLASLVTSAGREDLPVVISDGLEYLTIAEYATPPWSERFEFLADPPAAFIFAGNESLDKELMVLRSFAPLRVYDYPAFASQQRSFLLYSSNGSGGDPQDWWPERLLRDGYVLKVLAVNHSRVIYLVAQPQEAR